MILIEILCVLCVLFTAYFFGTVIFETYVDVGGIGAGSRWGYAKKFASKFWDNFIYRLP